MFPFFILALLLGFKHSYDADHLVAVSNLLVRSPNAKRTVSLSVAWSLGHMATASIITLILFSFKELVLSSWLGNLEISVAIMLIAIGVLALLWETRTIHTHSHRHGHIEHSHPHLHLGPLGDHGKMLGIGIVHGIASNDELLLLFVFSLEVTSLVGLILGVAVFSVGVVLGMVLFGMSLTYPLRKWSGFNVRRAVNLSAAFASLLYGSLLLLGLEAVNPFTL